MGLGKSLTSLALVVDTIMLAHEFSCSMSNVRGIPVKTTLLITPTSSLWPFLDLDMVRSAEKLVKVIGKLRP